MNHGDTEDTEKKQHRILFSPCLRVSVVNQSFVVFGFQRVGFVSYYAQGHDEAQNRIGDAPVRFCVGFDWVRIGFVFICSGFVSPRGGDVGNEQGEYESVL